MSVRKFSSASISSAAIKSSKLWDQETFPGTYESISTAIVDSSGASSITFSNIPQNYTHLQIRCIARTDRTSYFLDYASLRFNSDTGANYAFHHPVYGDGSSTYSYAEANKTAGQILRFTGTLAPSIANAFGAAVVDILDYKDTNKYKTVRNLGGADVNTAGELGFYSSLWMSTSAISSITIAPGGGTQFNQYTHFALYGIRGA